MSTERQPTEGNRFFILWIIWFALAASVVFYSLVSFLIVGGPDFAGRALPALFFPILAVAAIALFAAQKFVRNNLKDEKLFPMILKRLSAPAPRESSDEGTKAQLLLQNHTLFNIIVWALGESTGIFGFVLTMISGDMRYTLGFGAYSLLNLFYFRPDRAAFDEQLMRLKRLNL